ncbi:MAG: oligoendopeptidase F [Chloroflexota bacterium]
MSPAHLPARNEVDPRHTWNAESVFASVDQWSAELAALSAGLDRLGSFKGRLGESPTILADAFHTLESFKERAEKALVYASLTESVDRNDQAATARAGQAGSLFGRLQGAVAYFEPELLTIGRDQLMAWAATEPRLSHYAHYFDDLFRRQAHVRSPEVEEVLGLAADAFGNTYATFSKLADSDFKFRPVASAGGELPVSQGTVDDLLNSPDRAVRRAAWESYHDQYLAYKNTLSSNLATSIKQNVLLARVRRYDSTLDMALFAGNIPAAVYHNLLDTFKKHRGVWQRYFDVRRRALGVDSLHTYDIWAPLTVEKSHVPYEQAVEWISAALAPLGHDYADRLRRGCLEDRWVDIYPNEGKSSGAFSWGVQGTHPFIVMSYTDDANSMGTLAHELGHSMHSYLSWANQPPVYADYSLFAAEVASNFNQAMLRAYLLEQDIDPQLKIAVIEEAMSNFHRYFLEMPTLALFELEMHRREERGDGLTADDMIDTMADLFAESYGNAATIDRRRDGIRWATFSHLYADYYVYQYATGISGANALARRVLSGEPGAAEGYLGFLSAGGSRYPLEALQAAGVDLTQPQPVEAAFAMLGDLIDRLDELVNQ